jgi:hypothetical protein
MAGSPHSPPPPVNIAVVMEYDAQSYRADEIKKRFLLEHMEHPQQTKVGAATASTHGAGGRSGFHRAYSETPAGLKVPV